MANPVDNITRVATGFSGDSAIRSGLAAASGGVGAALRRATAAATDQAVDTGAQRLATRIRSRQNAEEEGAKSEGSKKIMVGWVFYTVLALTVAKDVTDIFADASVILSAVTPVTGILVSFVVACYLYVERVEMTSNKAAAYMISLALEYIPILNAIPAATLVLCLTKFVENRRRAKSGEGASGITRHKDSGGPAKGEGVTRARRG